MYTMQAPLKSCIIEFLLSLIALGFLWFLIRTFRRLVWFRFEVTRDGRFLETKSLPSDIAVLKKRVPDILIRESTKEIYNSVSTFLMAASENSSPSILVTGVPGIGKSLLLIYFLYRFVSDSRFRWRPIVLQFEKGVFYYFVPLIPGFIYSYSFLTSAEQREKVASSAIMLVDIDEKAEPNVRGWCVLIFASPEETRYKNIMKRTPHATYILPTWDKEELEKLGHNKDFYERYAMFGGVPRLVLADDLSDSPEKELQEALTWKGRAIAESYFDGGHKTLDIQTSSMLIHVNPPRDENGAFEYRGMPVYTFCSDYVFQKLLTLHKKLVLAGARNHSKSGASKLR